MRLEITENDILLLKLASSALIIFLVVRFLLMPRIAQLQEYDIQNDTLAETIAEMQASIDSIPGLEQRIESGKKELAEISATYYERMENHQVDELLTGIALKHGLFPVSLAIEETAPMIPEAYLYGVTAAGQGAVSDHYILTGRGNMVLRGEEGQFLSFLNDLENNYPALRLCSLQMDEQIYFDEDWNVVEQPDMSCTLEVYMHE